MRTPPRFPGLTIAVTALATAALVTACGGGAATTPDPPAAVSVTTAKSVSREVPVYLTASGSILADEVTAVAARVSGVVAETPVDIGTYLEEGAVIVVLDENEARLQAQQATADVSEAEAALQSARSNAEEAQRELEAATANAQSMSELFDKGGISRNQYNQALDQRDDAADDADRAQLQVVSAQAALDSARARAELANNALAFTRISAPFAGYLSGRTVSKGEFVTTGRSVAQVARLDPVQVEVHVPEVDLPALSVGLDATAAVAAHPDKTFSGTVSAVSPVVDPVTRAVTVKIGFANPDAALRPGMFATVRIAKSQTESAVFVPGAAVTSDANTGSSQVYVVANGQATLQIVQVGETSGDQVRIVTGLDAGVEVATSNLAQLRDGARVTTGS